MSEIMQCRAGSPPCFATEGHLAVALGFADQDLVAQPARTRTRTVGGCANGGRHGASLGLGLQGEQVRPPWGFQEDVLVPEHFLSLSQVVLCSFHKC